MQNSIWKLTALTVVVAVGFSAVLMTQRGLENAPVQTGPPADRASAKSGRKIGAPRNPAQNSDRFPEGNRSQQAVGQSQWEPPRGAANPFSEAPAGSGSGMQDAGGSSGDVQLASGVQGSDNRSARPAAFPGRAAQPIRKVPAGNVPAGSGSRRSAPADSPFAGANGGTPPFTEPGNDGASARPTGSTSTGGSKPPADHTGGNSSSGGTRKDDSPSPPLLFDSSTGEKPKRSPSAGSASPAASGNGTKKTPSSPDSDRHSSPHSGPSGGGNPFAPFSGSGNSADSSKPADSPLPSSSGGKNTAAPEPAPSGNPFASQAGASPTGSDGSATPPAGSSTPSSRSPFPATPRTGNDGEKPPQPLFGPPPKTAPSASGTRGTDNSHQPVASDSLQKPGETASPKTKPAGNVPQRLPDTAATPLPKGNGSVNGNTESRGNNNPATGNPAAGSSGKAATTIPAERQQPRLTIEKKAPPNAVLGRPFVYDIVIRNQGASSAHQVVVQDPIPPGVQLVGSDPQALLSGKTLMWKLGTIPAGQKRIISVKVTPIRAGQIGSVATVNFVSEVASRTVIQTPRLKLEFTGPPTAKRGETVRFRFKVSNVGSAAAKNVWIRDILPDGLSHPAGNDLEYEIGTLPAGKSEEVTLSMRVVQGGTLTNRAILTADGGVRVEAKSVLTVDVPKLVITRSGPKKKYVGLKAVYQNLVTNNSPGTVNAVTVTEVVPPGMDFVEASEGGTFDAAQRQVVWNIGRLGPGDSKTLRLVLLPRQTGVKQSRVLAMVEKGAPVQVTSATTIEGYAVLGLEIPPLQRPVSVGEQTSLRLVVRNRGTAASHNVRLQVTLPAQLSLLAVRGRGKYTTNGGTLTFEPRGQLANGESMAFDLVFKAIGAGDARVRVQIQSNEMSRPLLREEAVLILPGS